MLNLDRIVSVKKINIQSTRLTFALERRQTMTMLTYMLDVRVQILIVSAVIQKLCDECRVVRIVALFE